MKNMDVLGYDTLADVLHRAYDQAARGKGADRHANGKPFSQQPMQDLIHLYGIGFALGQVAKKAEEAQRMDREPAVRELLGAINYLAGAVIALERDEGVATLIGAPAPMPMTAPPNWTVKFAEGRKRGEWIDWQPGLLVPPDHALVEVEFRCGERCDDLASSFTWAPALDHEIVRYRVLK